MTSESLRAELETIYASAADALASADCDAFLEAVQPPAGVEAEAMRADFANAVPHFHQVIPELTATTFVAVRTEGDDVAGYYHMRPHIADWRRQQILLSRFVRVEGRWKLLLSGAMHLFEPDLAADPVEEAESLIDTHPDLCLHKRGSAKG